MAVVSSSAGDRGVQKKPADVPAIDHNGWTLTTLDARRHEDTRLKA